MDSPILDNAQSLRFFLPELVLVGAILAIIAWDLAVKSRFSKIAGILVLCILALAFSAGSSAWALAKNVPSKNLFYGLLAYDRFANLFRILFALVTGAIVVFSAPTGDDKADVKSGEGRDPGEFFTLLMVLTLGMNLMAASRNMLMIYLSLELVSVISFVMAGFKINDGKSSEAAMKYVIFGGVASGIMLYGMSWIFGLTQSLNLGECAEKIAMLTQKQGKVPEPVFVGVVCMMAGFGYKISAAPFHMWTPDVYEGAPTSVTAFLSVGPKAAGFAVLVRFFADALGAFHGADAAAATDLAGKAIASPWPVLAGCLAMATMTVGNLSALGQDNVKRMLAFSSVAHAGYMLLGFSTFTDAGIASIVFYVVTYCFMNLGAFLVVMAIAEQNGGDETLAAFKGLGRRAPIQALVMSVFLFSLTGLPPLAGFVGKFYLFSALVRAGGTWNWTVAVVGVINSVISVFYYARVVRAMYLEKGATEPTTVRKLLGATSVALAVPVIGLGLYWAPVYDFVARSITMVR